MRFVALSVSPAARLVHLFSTEKGFSKSSGAHHTPSQQLLPLMKRYMQLQGSRHVALPAATAAVEAAIAPRARVSFPAHRHGRRYFSGTR